ncbi:hypothetical protein F2Q68_00024425 [Brassica cretica]|uniref:DUF3444 domain-containing protein n=1 Tax=Brassica cretica TaxID=69181 RepID=A0A8S9I6W6_BRACR|nr:hypothetical protein F2Q68_00024425 [Brassica cretica]
MVTASDGDAPEWYKILKEGFKLVNEAFEVLSDKVRRNEYDMRLRIRIQGDIGACDGETSTFSNGACSSKIITYTRRKKRVGEGGESLRRVSEAGEMREEEAEALNAPERKRDRGKLNQENYMADEDCEMYDFDKDRMPRSFKKGQVWAVYDGGDDDRMPRSYCLVSEVVSLNPFKVWITWLDFESEKLISWVKISSCGRFRVSEKALVEQVKLFSHVVNCERVARQVYQIYPRKGSVWAVHSETSPGLQRRKTRRYEIVVCLTMYSDAYGLSVAYLEKVNEECSNLFKRRDYGYKAVRWVEKDDVAALLSHQIPAEKLPEDQSRAGLRESWVLDLASVPPDLVAATL